jgi:hypothetical protein
MLLVLKIPIVYLCAVLWWAIRAEPRGEEPAALVPAVSDTPPAAPAWTLRARLRRRSRGGPPRRPSGAPSPALRARGRR